MTSDQKKAYEWAKNQNYPSVAARYAKELAGLVDELHVASCAMQEQERKAATGEGLRCKYIVRKADTGEGVGGCFVLRPDRDRAAVAALRAYAAATDNDVLATDILNWVGQESNEPLTLDELSKRNEPVFVPINDFPNGGYWCLCENGYIIPPSGYGFMAKERPNWVFYSRKPEEDDHA